MRSIIDDTLFIVALILVCLYLGDLFGQAARLHARIVETALELAGR